MQTRTRLFVTALALAAVVASMVGCEDTDIVAPDGSTITVIASPAAVFIDQDSGETQGQTTITAQVVDGSGFPLKDIKLFFSTTGGILSSAGETLETNNNGIVSDLLTLRLIEDPDTVSVSVQSTNLVGRVDVEKTINLGPADPQAVIEADPPLNQNTGKPVSFDGSNSSFDPLVELECFDWTLDSTVTGITRHRGKFESFITETFDVDQFVNVVLRVSDETDINCATCSDLQGSTPCGLLDPADVAKLSIFTDSVNIEIRCDFTSPVVDAGPNQTRTFPAGGSVAVELNAVASDPDSPDFLEYSWECGNGTGTSFTLNDSSATCVYDEENAAGYQVKVKVRNECGLISTDTLTVIVLEQ